MIIEPNKKQKSKPVKKTTFEHKQIINQLLKTISDTPMDEELKMILRMRIWGKSPDHFDPMNYIEIAVAIGATEKQVMAWEEEAKHYIKAHMERHSLIDSIQRFNEDRANKERLFNPGGRIIRP